MRVSLTDNNAVRFGFGQAEFGSYLCTVPYSRLIKNVITRLLIKSANRLPTIGISR